jgi:cytosine/adenosine deaminase-related metal-dependent hydrolase
LEETSLPTAIFAANLVLPVSAPPINNGALLVQDGRIAAIGSLEELRRENPGVEARYFPRHTIVPGAVNAHAHLGFRRGDEPEGGSFSRWMTELISRLPEKAAWTPEAAMNSAQEAIEAGTTFVAESSLYGECLPQLADSGLAGRAYAEFLPFEFDSPEGAVEFIEEKVRSLRKGLPLAGRSGDERARAVYGGSGIGATRGAESSGGRGASGRSPIREPGGVRVRLERYRFLGGYLRPVGAGGLGG